MVYHDGNIFIVDAIVVDGRFQQMGVFVQPRKKKKRETFISVDRSKVICELEEEIFSSHHLGRFNGLGSMFSVWELLSLGVWKGS